MMSFFCYPQNNPSLRCPISSGVQPTSKIYLLMDFIMEGEILATVTECKLIDEIHKIKKLWISFTNPNLNQNFQIKLTAKEGIALVS